jgi:hypothetical protein
MAWLPALPFERGTTHDSGTLGGVPVTNLGAKIMLGDGTVLQICKNTDAAALSGCKLVDFESALSAGVTEASGAGSKILAGVVDPALANAGNTVPANALFYVVKQGVSYVLAGASVTVNAELQSHGTDGTCQDAGDISGQVAKVFGVSLAATASGSSVLCLVSFKG